MIKNRIHNISNNSNLTINTPITTAKIELTGICSLQCSFCYNNEMKIKNIRQKFLTDNDFNIILNSIKQIPTLKEIGLFYMGESGLHPKLDIYYKQIKENNYFTYLTTNATYIKNILKAIPYIDSLKVSWNYRDVNDFIIKTNQSKELYFKIIDNINSLYQECKKNNKLLAISTVLDTTKQDYLNSLSNLSYDEHYFIPLQNQGGSKVNGLNGVVGEYDQQVSPIPCWSLFKGLYIDVDLNIRVCCYGHENKHILGNLHKNNINDILLNKRIYKEQQLNNIIPDICSNCLKF